MTGTRDRCMWRMHVTGARRLQADTESISMCCTLPRMPSLPFRLLLTAGNHLHRPHLADTRPSHTRPLGPLGTVTRHLPSIDPCFAASRLLLVQRLPCSTSCRAGSGGAATCCRPSCASFGVEIAAAHPNWLGLRDFARPLTAFSRQAVRRGCDGATCESALLIFEYLARWSERPREALLYVWGAAFTLEHLDVLAFCCCTC